MGGAGTAGRGILISVYNSSSSSVFGDSRGTAKGDGSGVAVGVVTAGLEESKLQNGST